MTLLTDWKLAVAVHDDLETWQKVNLTAFVVSGLGSEHPDLIGEPYVDVGNLVGAKDDTLLATIVRMDPIHAYFDVDLDRVWETVTDDLPPLMEELERLLAG